MSQIDVTWASHAKIGQSLATDLRGGAFNSISEMSNLLGERKKLDEGGAECRAD